MKSTAFHMKSTAFHEKRRFSKDHLQGIVTLCLTCFSYTETYMHTNKLIVIDLHKDWTFSEEENNLLALHYRSSLSMGHAWGAKYRILEMHLVVFWVHLIVSDRDHKFKWYMWKIGIYFESVTSKEAQAFVSNFIYGTIPEPWVWPQVNCRYSNCLHIVKFILQKQIYSMYPVVGNGRLVGVSIWTKWSTNGKL